MADESAKAIHAPQNGQCADTEYLHDDPICGFTAEHQRMCSPNGDGLCHLQCETDADCGEVGVYCSVQGLFAGGDFGCNNTIRICRTKQANDCGK